MSDASTFQLWRCACGRLWVKVPSACQCGRTEPRHFRRVASAVSSAFRYSKQDVRFLQQLHISTE